MVDRAAQLAACVALAVCAVACAHSETVVHLSAPHEVRWEVRDEDGAHVCWLPCNLELDEQESVNVVRSDGRTRFVLRQEDLGEGAFSGSVHARQKHTSGTMAARVVGAALSGAGSVLVQSDDKEHVAWGVVLSGVGAAARAASDASRPEHEELWVQRTSTP
jgi:hypothetical protein